MMGVLDEPNYWAMIKMAAIRLASMGRIKARAFAPAERRGCGRVKLAAPSRVVSCLWKRLLVSVWFIGRKPNENRRMFGKFDKELNYTTYWFSVKRKLP
jgi:hypothetical protein